MRASRRSRRGAVLVLSVFLMIAMLAIIAVAVDLGYLRVVNSQLQRSADAAAIAATHSLIQAQVLAGQGCSPDLSPVSCAASQYAGLNKVAQAAPALAASDVTIGRIAYPFTPNSTVTSDWPNRCNAVKISVRRTAEQNGPVTLFFARMLGINSSEQSAEATAAFVGNFQGFKTPTGTAAGSNLMILPFALDKCTWDGLLAGVGSDDWRYSAECQNVSAGRDNVLEVNLYPQGTGSPGNRGTVDIGSCNNSTADIARQIVYGISAADLAYHGGKLELDATGKLLLNGDTGISAGVKDELASIRGQPRLIPIFSAVSGPGNNAQYTIVKFVGVRIMEVKLTTSSKRVIVQPARMIVRGGIPATGEFSGSDYAYSPVQLVK